MEFVKCNRVNCDFNYMGGCSYGGSAVPTYDDNCNVFEPCITADERDLIGEICVFNTDGQDSEYKIYDGEKCIVKKRVDESTYDFADVGTMYEIKFKGEHDGSEAEAFADELELFHLENNVSFI
jgi:hypothetical protein